MKNIDFAKTKAALILCGVGVFSMPASALDLGCAASERTVCTVNAFYSNTNTYSVNAKSKATRPNGRITHLYTGATIYKSSSKTSQKFQVSHIKIPVGGGATSVTNGNFNETYLSVQFSAYALAPGSDAGVKYSVSGGIRN